MRMSRRDSDMGDARRAYRDSMKYLETRRDESKGSSAKKNPTKTLIEAAEVGLGAAGVGYLAGRLGTTSIGTTGIPLGLVIGVAGHALAMYAPVGDKYGSHLQNVSNGAFAAWLAMWGAGQGGQARAQVDNAAQGLPIRVGQALPQAHHDQVGAAPSYPSAPAPRMMNAPNPWAGNHIPPHARHAVQPAPLSEAELQAMSRDMR